MTEQNQFNLTIATPLSGKELIQLLQQYPDLTIQHINKKKTAYKPLTQLEEKQFMILDQMRIPARNIFAILGQKLCSDTARRKAAMYRRKLGLPARHQGKQALQYQLKVCR
jgi:hypothetical protein